MSADSKDTYLASKEYFNLTQDYLLGSTTSVFKKNCNELLLSSHLKKKDINNRSKKVIIRMEMVTSLATKSNFLR